ncbi:MAG: class I SAM-dependent methyltransferase [Verrucomicrobiota bacterium]
MSERYDQYDSWAWLYDQTVGPEYGREQFSVLQRVLIPKLKEGAKLFDLCCGTGQLIEHLLRKGYEVVGLDGSEEMLKRAEINAPKAEYVLEDARKYKKPNYFDAAFSTSAALNHVPSVEDLKQVFENVYASLNEVGVFVFDLNHPEQMEKWWRGRPLEGMIAPKWAYMVTPFYQSDKKEGFFRVHMSRQVVRDKGIGALMRPIKDALYTFLSRARLVGLRIRLIRKIREVEPAWDHQENDFEVTAHEINAVQNALRDVGFSKVSIQTLEGDSKIDSNHSAYFICEKRGAV